MLFVVAVAVVAVTVVGLLMYLHRKASSLPKMDGPKYSSIVFEQLQDPRILLTTKMLAECKKYPKMFQQRRFSPGYVVHDTLLIKDLFLSTVAINHRNAGEIIYHPEKLPTTMSLISLRDDEWKIRRKALGHSFNNSKILGFVDVFAKKSNILCDILSKSAGEIIDLRPRFANLTVDVLGETVFGLDFGTQLDPSNHLSKAVDSFLNLGALGVFLVFPYWYKYPIKGLKRFLDGTNTLTSLCRQIATSRIVDTPKNDLLQTLVDLKLDLEKGLIPETLLFLVAGHETTSNLLSWTIHCISKNPHVEEKIVEEIRKVLGENQQQQITAENIDSFEYLECVVNESLRIFPPAMITDRHSSQPIELNGIKFPPCSTFIIPIWAIHHNENYWPEPEKFDPSRFDSEHKHKIVPNSFIPFGGGGRICIGWKFSLTEAKTVLATLYSKYSFKTQGEVKPVLGGGLLRPNNVNVLVMSRDNKN